MPHDWGADAIVVDRRVPKFACDSNTAHCKEQWNLHAWRNSRAKSAAHASDQRK
jgi:hypothetical protein